MLVVIVILPGQNIMYAATMPVNTSITSAPLVCFEHPCKTTAQGFTSQKNNTITALIGIGFNNASLQQIVKNKAILISYISSALDALKNGRSIGTIQCPGASPERTPTIVCGIVRPPPIQ